MILVNTPMVCEWGTQSMRAHKTLVKNTRRTKPMSPYLKFLDLLKFIRIGKYELCASQTSIATF